MTQYAVVIATCGGEEWSDLAWSRAVPSAEKQQDGQGDRPQLVVEHYPELTVSAARNAAAAHSTADWLIFLDADDELDDGYLCEIDCARGGVVIESETIPDLWPAPPLFVPAVQYVRSTGAAIARDIIARAQIPNLGGWPRVNECVIGTAVHRNLFERVGGFRDRTDDGTALVSIEDYDLWLRCFDAGAQIVHVPDAVYRAYVSSRSRNSDQSPYAAIWADHLARAT